MESNLKQEADEEGNLKDEQLKMEKQSHHGILAQASVPQNLAEEGSSWDMVSENDLWEGGNPELDGEEYVLVRQEDIVDGIACFMDEYLLSLKQTKAFKQIVLSTIGVKSHCCLLLVSFIGR